MHVNGISFSQVFTQLEHFCQLFALDIVYYEDDDDILQKLIASGSGLQRVEFSGIINSCLLQAMFGKSTLEELVIQVKGTNGDLPFLSGDKNTNLKMLTISGYLIKNLAALLPNITSLTYLRINYRVNDNDLLVLIDLVQSHTTLEELELSIHDYDEYSKYDKDGYEILTNLPKLIEAADSCQKKLEIDKEYYNYLPDDDDDVNSDEDDNNEEENEENKLIQ